MAYSINFYLDNAISKKQLEEIANSNDSAAKKDMDVVISKKELQIFVYLRYSGKTIKVFTSRKCTQKQWDLAAQRVDARYYKSGAVQLNKLLGDIYNEIGAAYEANNNKGIETSKEDIKRIIDKLTNKATKERAITFESAFAEFLSESKLIKSPSTIKNYEVLLKRLKEFAAAKRAVLSFELINSKFEISFREFVESEKTDKETGDKIKGVSSNTVAKYFKILKTFLSFAVKHKYYANIDFKEIKVKEREKEVYILTIPELMKLYNYEFTNKTYDKVRDVFCFSCFTGLRFSDIEQLRWDHIKDDELRITTKKTKENICINLNPLALAILEKHRGEEKPLPVISNQKTNEYLHEIGKALEFNEPVRLVEYYQGQVIEKFVPKYDVLSFHVSRKTFVTTSLILGMSERTVREFSGHKKEASFMKYVKIADTYKKKAMNDTWNMDNINKSI